MDIKEWLPKFEVSAETDNELQDYFFKTPEVQKIIDSRLWLLLGRKGVGKTAIYEHLKSADPKDINDYNVICLNFRDYPWPAHKLYKEALAGELAAYQKSWKYLFFVKTIAKLIEVKKQKKEDLCSDLKRAEKYINAIYGNPNPTLKEVIISKIMRIKSFSGPGVESGVISLGTGNIAFEDIAEDKQLQSTLRSNAFSLLDYFEKIFKENCGNHKFLIALDQLDENWLSGQIEEYSKVLINSN